MPETVAEAKRELHEARQEQRQKAAAFWQDTVNQGRVMRQETAQQDRAAGKTKKRGADRDRGDED